MPDKLAPEPCSGARFLARIERRCAGADWQRDPGEADVGTLPVIGDGLPSCLVSPVHSTGADILRPPGGANFLARVPGRCQEPGTGAIFPGTGQPFTAEVDNLV